MDRNILSPYIRVASRNSMIPPSGQINDRSLYDYEMILVEDGKCQITIDGDMYLCQKDDVVWIPPGVVHRFEKVGEAGFLQPHIHFDAVYSEKSLLREICYKPITQMTQEECELIQPDVFAECAIPYVFTPVDLENFRKTFYEMISIYTQKKPGFEILYKARLLEIINMILCQFDSGAETGEKTEIYSIPAIKSYIDNNFMRSITLEMLEKQFYINKFTLLRHFKKLYRKNIMTYYRELRLEYAQRLLTETGLTVRAIADRLDFEDAYSFSRFFKKYTGKSPKAYREEKNRTVEGKNDEESGV